MTDALSAAIAAACNALLGCLIAFNVALTSDQQAAIVSFVNALLFVWFVARHRKA